MFSFKNGLEIMGIRLSISSIFPFRVNVWAAGKGVRLGTEAAGTKFDDKIELRKVFRPVNLPPCQLFRRLEILEVVVIRNDKNFMVRAFKVSAPLNESDINRKEFCVVNVIIKFGGV